MLKTYKPISLLPALDKIFEKIIYNTMCEYLSGNAILTLLQSCFRKGDSCVYQLLAVVHNIYKNLDNKPSLDTRGVFLNMSTAFVKVWHKGLLFKPKTYGIDGKLPALIF